MKILDNSDKHLLPILPEIISKELHKNADKFKFIGGGSFGFTRKLVKDILTFPAFQDAEIALMDSVIFAHWLAVTDKGKGKQTIKY